MEIPTRDVCLGVVAGGEPDLRQVRLIHIVGRAGAAHLGRHPAGLQRVRENAPPTPGNGEGEHRIMELALGVRGRAVPAALLPEDVVEVGIGMVMHAGTEIDEPFRPLDQRGQDVGRQRVDREDVWQAIGCDAMPFPIADSSIMDHGIEATERVGLGGELLCAGDGFDIADYDRLSLGQGAPGIFCAVGITGMQDDPMSLAREKFAAIRPRPVVEPEMKMRDMIFLLWGCFRLIM